MRAQLLLSMVAAMTLAWIPEGLADSTEASESVTQSYGLDEVSGANLVAVGAEDQTEKATSDSSQEQARRHFAEALVCVQEGRLAEGLRSFERAYAISPHHAVLYNIARTQERLGQYRDAITSYAEYLRIAGDGVDLKRRTQVESTLWTLQKEAQVVFTPPRVTSLSFLVEPRQAHVALDGRTISSRDQMVVLAPGDHIVEFSLPGYLAERRTLHLDEGQSAILTATLVQVPKGPPSVPLVVEPKLRISAQEAVGITLGGVGVVLSAAALGIYVWNDSRYADWKTERAVVEDLTPQNPNYDSLRATSDAELRSIKNADVATWVTGIAGGVCVIAGAFVYIFKPKKSERGFSIAPFGARYVQRF